MYDIDIHLEIDDIKRIESILEIVSMIIDSGKFDYVSTGIGVYYKLKVEKYDDIC